MKEGSEGESLLPGDKVSAVIAEEVRRDIAPLLADGDLETAEFLKGVMQDSRQTTYSFLSWIRDHEQSGLVLYPASGFNQIPKLAFGEDKVVHTSLEHFDGNNINYYDQLGTGVKVITDNRTLPFKDESFDIVCLLDAPEDDIGDDPEAYLKVLWPGGLIILSQTILNLEDDSRMEKYAEIKLSNQYLCPTNFNHKVNLK